MKHNTHIQGSITFGAVFGLGLLAMTFAMIALSSVTNGMGTYRNEVAGLRAFVTSDTAAREGVYQLLRESTYNGAADWAALSDGLDINNVSISTVTVDRSTWPSIRVRGTADNALTHRKVQYAVRASDTSLTFDHAVYSQHDLSMSGSVTVTGSVYAGGAIDISNAAATLNGSAYASGPITVHAQADVGGDTIPGRDYLTPPYIDPAPYKTNNPICYQVVPASGQVSNAIKWSQCSTVYLKVTSGGQVKGGWPAHWSGVLYIEGDTKMNGGDFSCHGTCSNPLAIYIDGDLNLAGNVEVRGLVYVTGMTTVGNGNSEITGSLMSVGITDGVNVNGNLTVTYDPVLMGEWQGISGLNLSGHHTPVVSGWTEI